MLELGEGERVVVDAEVDDARAGVSSGQGGPVAAGVSWTRPRSATSGSSALSTRVVPPARAATTAAQRSAIVSSSP